MKDILHLDPECAGIDTLVFRQPDQTPTLLCMSSPFFSHRAQASVADSTSENKEASRRTKRDNKDPSHTGVGTTQPKSHISAATELISHAAVLSYGQLSRASPHGDELTYMWKRTPSRSL